MNHREISFRPAFGHRLALFSVTHNYYPSLAIIAVDTAEKGPFLFFKFEPGPAFNLPGSTPPAGDPARERKHRGVGTGSVKIGNGAFFLSVIRRGGKSIRREVLAAIKDRVEVRCLFLPLISHENRASFTCFRSRIGRSRHFCIVQNVCQLQDKLLVS